MENCINCGGKLKPVRTNGGVELYKCRGCGLLVSHGDGGDHEQEYGNLLESVKGVRRRNNKKNIKHIKELGLKNGFEVGCANGLFLKMAEKEGLHVRGIEPMADSYREAKGNGLEVYYGFFPEDLPEEVKDMDFVIFNDVFEHIPDSRALMESCTGILRDGGYLIINLPMSTGILYRIASALDGLGKGDVMRRLWQADTRSPHVLYYNQKSLCQVADGFGLKLARKARMKTYDARDLRKRVNAVNTKGMSEMGKRVYVMGGFMLAPFMNILPPDLVTFYFRKS